MARILKLYSINRTFRLLLPPLLLLYLIIHISRIKNPSPIPEIIHEPEIEVDHFGKLDTVNDDSEDEEEEPTLQETTTLSLCSIGIVIELPSSSPTKTSLLLSTYIKKLCGIPKRSSNYPYTQSPVAEPKNWFFINDVGKSIEGVPVISYGCDKGVCCRVVSMIKRMRYTWNEGMEWFMKVDEDSYVHPENLVTLLTLLNSSIPYMIGSKAYSVFDTEMGKMSSNVPYGPMDGFGYLNNTIHVNSKSGIIFSKKAVSLLYDNLDLLTTTCNEYPYESIALTKTLNMLNGKVLYHPGFHSKNDQVLHITLNLNGGFNMIKRLDSLLSISKNDGILEKQVGKAGNTCIDIIEYQQTLLLDAYGKLLEGVRRVAIIGFPDHSNKGDSAIWVGERILLEKLDVELVYQCETIKDFSSTIMLEKLGSSETSAIMLHGGGNFGDIYHKHQILRNKIVSTFPSFRIIAFPQTTFFSDIQKLNDVKEAYKNHRNLTLVARGIPSYDFLNLHFGELHQVLLTPDCAFMIGSWSDKRREAGLNVLVHQRIDKEAVDEHLTSKKWDQLKKIKFNSKALTYQNRDWIGWDASGINALTHDQKAWSRVISGFNFLSSGQLVITNRLHGHILLLLLGIPHILLDNSYGKISGYHSTWTSGCSLARRAGSIEEALELVKKFYQ